MHFVPRILLLLLLAMTGVAPAAPLRVALISDAACTDPKSLNAAHKVLTGEPSFQTTRVLTADLLAHLDDYDVYIFPGGTGGGQAKALGVEGGARLTAAVRGGKGLVAICAGGYLVAEGWSPETKAVELVNAKLWDDDHWARGEGFINVSVVADGDADTSRTMWFENGPIFVPAGRSDLPAYTPLVKYVTDMAAKDAPKGMMTGRDAVVAGPLGKGRVVAFGPHPELSPGLNHWLLNAVRWTAKGEAAPPPGVGTVLEGKPGTK